MKKFPAIDLQHENLDLLYAALDDLSPTALEERDGGLRAFFLTTADRDRAHRSLSASFSGSPVDVPDDDWARRSQEGLTPVTVGRITVLPNLKSAIRNPQPAIPHPQSAIELVILPSMGFGTGHHATTRLCLEALQTIDLERKTVVDIGTGSGVLALAARALGATRASGIDFDPDAIQSARENLSLNPGLSDVAFDVADLTSGAPARADVVTANLTGALLVRAASTLLATAAENGILILSGMTGPERDDVVAAFRPGTVVWERTEDEWVGLAVKKA